LAQSRAASAAHNSTAAPPVSVLRKSRTGAARFRAQAVRPVGGSTGVLADPEDPRLGDGSAPALALIARHRVSREPVTQRRVVAALPA
jgi:hypothetical protein